jgi:hypothetical protein
MSYSQNRTGWIEAKVGQAMSTSMENMAAGWPRIQTIRGDAGSFYTLDTSQQVKVFEFYRHTLEILNQDDSLPPIKVNQVSIWKDIGTTDDTLTIYATVEFPLIAGIDSKIYMHQNVTVPHFASPLR